MWVVLSLAGLRLSTGRSLPARLQRPMFQVSLSRYSLSTFWQGNAASTGLPFSFFLLSEINFWKRGRWAARHFSVLSNCGSNKWENGTLSQCGKSTVGTELGPFGPKMRAAGYPFRLLAAQIHRTVAISAASLEKAREQRSSQQHEIKQTDINTSYSLVSEAFFFASCTFHTLKCAFSNLPSSTLLQLWVFVRGTCV